MSHVNEPKRDSTSISTYSRGAVQRVFELVAGLRISEALALELRDVDLDAGTARVRHGKGDRSRTVCP